MSGIVSSQASNISSFDRRQASLLKQFEPQDSTIALQHFVEWFSGDDLNDIWTLAGTGAMVDSIDGGYEVDSAGGASTIYFNSIKPIAFDGSETIAIWKIDSTGNSRAFVGLEDNALTDFRGGPKIMFVNGSTFVFQRAPTGGSTATIDTGITADTVFHLWRIHSETNDGRAYHNGVLVASGGDNSTATCQPVARAQNIVVNIKVAIRYFEVYNF